MSGKRWKSNIWCYGIAVLFRQGERTDDDGFWQTLACVWDTQGLIATPRHRTVLVAPENRPKPFSNEFRRTTRRVCELRRESNKLSYAAACEVLDASHIPSRTTWTFRAKADVVWNQRAFSWTQYRIMLISIDIRKLLRNIRLVSSRYFPTQFHQVSVRLLLSQIAHQDGRGSVLR